MQLEHVVLLKATFVYQHLYALTGGIFTARMLLLDGFFSATQTCLLTLSDKLFDFFYLFAHNLYDFYLVFIKLREGNKKTADVAQSTAKSLEIYQNTHIELSARKIIRHSILMVCHISHPIIATHIVNS